MDVTSCEIFLQGFSSDSLSNVFLLRLAGKKGHMLLSNSCCLWYSHHRYSRNLRFPRLSIPIFFFHPLWMPRMSFMRHSQRGMGWGLVFHHNESTFEVTVTDQTRFFQQPRFTTNRSPRGRDWYIWGLEFINTLCALYRKPGVNKTQKPMQGF